MELRHLRYFTAVAETKNFSKAAQIVNVTQPAISRTIKDLEDELGVELFVRNPSGLLLTENGRRFLRNSHQILESADSAIREAHFANQPNESPRLRVGIEPTCSAPWLFKALLDFATDLSIVELEISDGRSDQMIQRLRAGELDLCLIPATEAEVPVDVESEIISRSRLHLVVSMEHRFSQMHSIDLPHLKDEPLILCDDSAHADVKQAALLACRRAGFQPPQLIRASSHFTMLALVAAKRGYGMHTEDSNLASGSGIVRQVPLMKAAYATRSTALWMRGADSEARDKFLQTLRVAAEKARPLIGQPTLTDRTIPERISPGRASPDASYECQAMRSGMGSL